MKNKKYLVDQEPAIQVPKPINSKRGGNETPKPQWNSISTKKAPAPTAPETTL